MWGEQVQRGERGEAQGYAFKKAGRQPCRVLAWWRPDAGEPWRLVTNHPRVTVEAYGLRLGAE